MPKPTPKSSFGSFEIQILEPQVPDKEPGGGENFTGALTRLQGVTVRANKPAGEWNQMYVKLENRQFFVELNGKKGLQARLEDFKSKANIRSEVFLRPKGYLGLQDWGTGRVEFRNLMLRSLSPGPG